MPAEKDLVPRSLHAAKPAFEALIAGATVAYALGYLSWAVHSSVNGLNLTPVLEGQYFIAGLIPALLGTGLVFGVWWIWRRRRSFAAERSPANLFWGRALEIAGGAMLVIGTVGQWLGPRLAAAFNALLVTGFAAGLAAAFFFRSPVDRWIAGRMFWIPLLTLPVLAVGGFVLYATRVFPHLPTEFGGPEKQCVALDLKVKELSPSTRGLLSGPVIRGDSVVARSRTVWLVTQTGNYFLVELPGAARGNRPAYTKVKDAVVVGIVDQAGCAR